MKIELITLHRVTNFGSLLQTYATQAYIESLGHRVEVIDYCPEGLSFYRAIWPKGGSFIKKLVKFVPLFVCNAYQFRMANSFLKENINLTPQRFKNFEELSKNYPKANVYLSGSDQVWNTQNNNPPQDLGAYYLGFTNSPNKVAYAGSFGKSDFSEEERLRIRQWLSSYKRISVREDSGLGTLSDLGFKGAHVVDPTLLLTKEQWKVFCKKKAPKSGYVFIYNLNRNKILEKAATEIAKKNDLRIVNFADTFEFVKNAENRFNNNPYDFINYISNADYVVTDSFHGTAFSINFERQFLCIAPPKYNCRLESILRMCGCTDRMFNNVEEVIYLSENIINYDIVSKRLNEARTISKKFLQEALQVDA